MSGAQEGRDALREKAKRRADALRERYAKQGRLMDWFDALYREAEGEAGMIPWAHEVARPEFVAWLDALPEGRRKGRALDIGCGLGDNAALLAGAGFKVTAFDISETAVDWARSRHSSLDIEWRVADLADPPPDFEGAFDLVNETYTIQSLRPPHREKAIESLARLVKPGGTVLIIGRGRHADEPENPPPWPITLEELECLEESGLQKLRLDDFHTDRNGVPVRHFRIEYRKR